MKNKCLISVFIFSIIFVSCKRSNDNQSVKSVDYSDTTFWFSTGDDNRFDADIFYVYPTVTMTPYVENDSSWFADITRADVRELANENQRFNKMLYDECNFYAPYYGQIVFEAYHQPDSVVKSLLRGAYVDVKAAFDYYMAHYNNNRPYFLLGHSQGSQVLMELLKNGIEDADRQRLLGAYCIGCAVTSEELAAYPKLQPATDSVTGTLIVFNSATKPDAFSPLFADNAVCINPLIWTIDTVYAPSSKHLGIARFSDDKDSIIFVPGTVSGRLENNLMVCDSLDPNMVYIEAFADFFPYGNLHFADSWLYAGNVKANMRTRLANYKAK